MGGIFVRRWIVFLTATIFTLGITKQSYGGFNCANAPNRVIVSGPKYVEVNKSATYTCTVDTQGGTYVWTAPGFTITSGQGTGTLVVQAQGTPSVSKGDKKVKCVYTRPEGACDGYIDATIIKVDTQCLAATPLPKTRTKVGVCEKITMTLKPSGLSPISWSKTGDGLLSATTGASVTFTAHDRASTPSVKATYDGKDYTINFTVVEPSGAYQIKYGSTINHAGVCDAGFRGITYLLPKDVSFEFIEINEGTCNATATGSFATAGWNNLPHPAWPAWASVSTGNSTTGCKVQGPNYDGNEYFDYIHSGDLPAACTAGKFTWDIPWEFRKPGGAASPFTTLTHYAEADGARKMTISKGGITASSTEP